MSFIDRIKGFKITATCRRYCHNKKTIGPCELCYEYKKKNWASENIQKRFFFFGKLTYCARTGCDYEEFEGSRQVVRITYVVNGTEYSEEDYERYRRENRESKEAAKRAARTTQAMQDGNVQGVDGTGGIGKCI